MFWFEASLGLRINLDTSELIPVGEVDNVEDLAAELGCRVESLPSTYLGLSLGASHKSMAVWNGIKERMRKRLAIWERSYISKGERVTLIKSTLASMLLYQMSLLRIPKVVANRMERLQRDFLWGGGVVVKRSHLVNWEVVCSDKEQGGLGVRNLSKLDKALLDEWV